MDSIKEKVQQVINQIYQENGEVRPSVLLETAKPKSSPAHDAFEWDNKKAGNEYRLMQARQWIRRVEIIIEDKTERLVHIPTISVEGEISTGIQEGYYKPISIVTQDKIEFDAALKASLKTLNAAREAYNDLKTASKIAEKGKAMNFNKADRGFEMVESALSASA